MRYIRIYFLEPRTKGSYKSEGTKDFHAQMTVIMGEQFKGNMDIVPDITTWMGKKHCVLNYYMTQFLTGLACFRKYLHKFVHDTSPIYPNCVDEEEDAKYILTCCPRFR